MSDNEIRLSQLVMSFGPGAMIDLPTRSVILGGLPLWREQIKPKVIQEPRLQEMLERSLRDSGRLAEGVSISLRQPPVAEDINDRTKSDVPALIFPKWFVCDPDTASSANGGGSKRRMVRWEEMEWASGKFKDDKKAVSVTPLRFVAACKKGHIQDINWRHLVHRDQACRNKMWLVDKGTSADPKDLSVECDCGKRVEFDILFSEGILGNCSGKQPWLGDDKQEQDGCPNKLKLLIRGATNAYFPQVARVISLPTGGDPVEDVIKSNMAALSTLASVEQLQGALAFSPELSTKFAGRDLTEIFAIVQRLKSGEERSAKKAPSPKLAEFDALASGQETIGSAAMDTRLHAETLPPEVWQTGQSIEYLISNVVAVKRLTEVVCLYGFTRLEPAPVAADGSLEEVFLSVEGASLGDTDWLPAVEQFGEGIFLQFDPAAIAGILNSDHNETRVKTLRSAYQDWAEKFQNSLDFPGGTYAFLHSLSHGLMSQVALYCGYPASSLKERIYALADPEDPTRISKCGILIYTSATGSQGSLGGLVAIAPKISELIYEAISGLEICSNDPICSESNPETSLDGSLVNGAACHGCILAPETSCEFRNMLLDRSLLVGL